MTTEPIDIDAASQRAREAALALAAMLPEVKRPAGTRLEGAYLGALVQAGRRHPDREARRLAHIADAAWWSMAMTALDRPRRLAEALGDTPEQRRDLYQAGILGLYRAAQRYDAAAGVMFRTYARRWVQSAIVRERYSWLVREPSRFNEIRLKARGLTGSADEIAAVIGCSVDDLLGAVDTRTDSLDANSTRPHDGETPLPIDHDVVGIDPTEATNDSIDIEAAIGRLSEDDQRIARLALAGMSDRQIGDAIGVTPMRASQLVSRVALELRAPGGGRAGSLNERLLALLQDGYQLSGRVVAQALGLTRAEAVALLKEAVRDGRIGWDKARRRYVEAA